MGRPPSVQGTSARRGIIQRNQINHQGDSFPGAVQFNGVGVRCSVEAGARGRHRPIELKRNANK